MDPGLVLFAIQAGVKLGRTIYDVLIDVTVEGPLLLPVGELFGDVQEGVAAEFFSRLENLDLIRPGGPYFGLSASARVTAYKTLRTLNTRLDDPLDTLAEATTIVRQLHAFEQVKQGFGTHAAWHRLLGTVIETGIDYFTANPAALGRDSSARRVVSTFISGLDSTDFAAGSRTQIIADIFAAVLHVCEANVALVNDDKRTQVLLGGITKALVAEIDAAGSEGDKFQREALLRRISSSLVRGGSSAFTEHIDLFVPHDNTTKTLVESTLLQVLAGIKGAEDLFTNAALEIVFQSALGTVGANAGLFTQQPILQELIARTIQALTAPVGRQVFAEETVSAIVRTALEVVHNHTETLLTPDDPQQRLLAQSVAAVVQPIAASLGGAEKVKNLLSTRQLVALTRVVLAAVAEHPAQLLDNLPADPRQTVLAEIIGAVARGLGDDPTRCVNGAGFIALVHTALQVTSTNVDKLIDLRAVDAPPTLLFRVLQQLATAVTAADDPRHIMTCEVFVEVAQRVLPVVSANVEAVLRDASQPVADTVRQALDLATGVLANRINGANLPVLIEHLLRMVLWEELRLAEPAAVELAARSILRAASSSLKPPL